MQTTIIITTDENGTVRSIIQASEPSGQDLGDTLATAAHRDPQLLAACIYTVGEFLARTSTPAFDQFRLAIDRVRPHMVSASMFHPFAKRRDARPRFAKPTTATT